MYKYFSMLRTSWWIFLLRKSCGRTIEVLIKKYELWNTNLLFSDSCQRFFDFSCVYLLLINSDFCKISINISTIWNEKYQNYLHLSRLTIIMCQNTSCQDKIYDNWESFFTVIFIINRRVNVGEFRDKCDK